MRAGESEELRSILFMGPVRNHHSNQGRVSGLINTPSGNTPHPNVTG